MMDECDKIRAELRLRQRLEPIVAALVCATLVCAGLAIAMAVAVHGAG
jgi:hypothetical protein